MTQSIDRLPATNALLAIIERASLYERLLSALRPRRKPEPLPGWLYADLGLEPTREREFISRGR